MKNLFFIFILTLISSSCYGKNLAFILSPPTIKEIETSSLEKDLKKEKIEFVIHDRYYGDIRILSFNGDVNSAYDKAMELISALPYDHYMHSRDVNLFEKREKVLFVKKKENVYHFMMSRIEIEIKARSELEAKQEIYKWFKILGNSL